MKCENCSHAEMCRWIDELEGRGCDFGEPCDNEKHLNKAYYFGGHKGVMVYLNKDDDTVTLPEKVFKYILSLVPSEKESAE